ncbi:sirtuin-like protein [Encephalitozoon hellem ATCC 50504]|uniref:NAD-dependent histone deacetylase Sir2 n=1 Tax=Encephalitozoon hellem TaxID=27973 RepID=A0A9Q9CBD1_ENCHE|nr:sirtuin-like protein [Encephalitozoon hellem ATCC 50504]AFM97934.1 sirtuin-like protein [Encephalitozoon hellem ATCC 50504]UTX42738.1 NAD-dependent histone deacetylase Sir2 [Encephalitozoon hellem]WEL38197.1 Sir2-like protein [Encephalitozoon hellem]|eukprot:XP_003886915.1 sirtuin-like protein [Encephalitozoon hellem ATCC 50504]
MIVIDSKWIKSNIKMFSKRKVAVVVGAGISVSSGIPDFRSKSGIFSDIKKDLGISGSDLFTYSMSMSKEMRKNYLKYMSKLKGMVDRAVPSPTHEFLSLYSDASRKFRMYTQNIDGLEEKAGLVASKDKSAKLVYLHGNMKKLSCLYCGYKIEFGDSERGAYGKGEEIICPNCIKRNEKRGKDARKRPVGVFHTTIIHYNQSHPDSSFISRTAQNDSDCDLFIVMGTSLKVFGVKKLVKYFCRLNTTRGRRILVNLDKPSKEFRELFDFFWNGDCDEFCKALGEELGLKSMTDGVRRLSITKKEDCSQPLNVPERNVATESDVKVEGKMIEKEVRKHINLLIKSSRKKGGNSEASEASSGKEPMLHQVDCEKNVISK